jgi:hypothetical protein
VIIPEGICLPDHPAAASGTSERKAHRSSTIPRSQKTEKKTPTAKADQKTPRDTDTMTTDSPKADATDTATVQPWGNHTKKASHNDANSHSTENDSKCSTKHSKPANTQDKPTKSKKTVYRNPKNKTASTLSLKK